MKYQVKPIPKYILSKIKKLDKECYKQPQGTTRYYAYLVRYKNDILKVTVAVRNKYKDWHYKQVAVHSTTSQYCMVKDMAYFCMGGYVVGWFSEGLTKYPKWYESDHWYYADDKYFNPHAPVVNTELALKLTQYKYSAVDKYNGEDVLKYLKIYKQYPQIEYLTKLGLSRLVMLKSVLKKISKDRNFFKWLAKNRQQLANKYYYSNVIHRAYTSGKSLEYLQKYEVFKKSLIGTNLWKELRQEYSKEVNRLLDYLVTQDTNINSYVDYIRACKYLNLDTSLEKHRYPHNFKHWHDIRIDEYNTAKLKDDEIKRQAFYKQFEQVAIKYETLQKYGRGFIAIIAHSPKELICEGEELKHCVGKMNYDQKFAREESLIFFIRNKEQPKVPFVTVEYSLEKRKVLQCYGEKDSKPSEQVLHFVNKIWLPYANRQLKQITA